MKNSLESELTTSWQAWKKALKTELESSDGINNFAWILKIYWLESFIFNKLIEKLLGEIKPLTIFSKYETTSIYKLKTSGNKLM